jgi:predicted Fe-Mo cluster-binding NifX family protein
MIVAIPAFDSKVSPRFDTAQELIVLEMDNGTIINRERRALDSGSVSGKIKVLLDLGVNTLICGGIDRLSRQQLRFNRIEVYAWVTGEIDDALSCFLSNGLNSGTILGSNGKKVGRWQFRQRGHLRNVLQKSAHRADGEVSVMPQGNQDRMGRGQKKGGRGHGKGKGKGGTGCPGSGQGGRRGTNTAGAGMSGKEKNRRGTGQN